MPVDVTVVVPVYNPGEFIEPCIESLLAQSLPPERYEIIFVDDGSTDDTPARLDKVADEAPQVRVFHIPNSGWPGKPRNVGIDNARGEYVYFCDHDDKLGPEALERLVAFARRNDSDIVLGKIVGHGRGAPRAVFRENVDDAPLFDSNVITNLTPQKLFRKAFLDDLGIRFPEGKRRLEDHVFVMEAYLQARRISILGDYPVYHHLRRDDGGNAAHQSVDPAYYYTFVRETIDVIERFTEPGSPERLQLLARPFRHELMHKLRKRGFLDGSRDHQERWLEEVRTLLVERFPEGFEDDFPLITRARTAAVRAGDVDTTLAIGREERALRAHGRVTSMRWADGVWVVDVEAQLRFHDGAPIRIIRDADGTSWPDERLAPRRLLAQPLADREVERARVSALVVHRTRHDEWMLPVEATSTLAPVRGAADDVRRLVFRGTITIDPERCAGGPLRPGQWDLRIRVVQFGASAETRIQVRAPRRTLSRPVVAGAPAVAVVPYATERGHLALDVGPRQHSLLDRVSQPNQQVTLEQGALLVALDIDVSETAKPLPVTVELRTGGRPVAACHAAIVADPAGGARLRVEAPHGTVDRPGGRHLAVVGRVRPKDRPVTLGMVRLDEHNRFTDVRGPSSRDVPLTERALRYGRHRLATPAARARRYARAARRRLPRLG